MIHPEKRKGRTESLAVFGGGDTMGIGTNVRNDSEMRTDIDASIFSEGGILLSQEGILPSSQEGIDQDKKDVINMGASDPPPYTLVDVSIRKDTTTRVKSKIQPPLSLLNGSQNNGQRGEM